jgi:hypothetical protein
MANTYKIDVHLDKANPSVGGNVNEIELTGIHERNALPPIFETDSLNMTFSGKYEKVYLIRN